VWGQKNGGGRRGRTREERQDNREMEKRWSFVPVFFPSFSSSLFFNPSPFHRQLHDLAMFKTVATRPGRVGVASRASSFVSSRGASLFIRRPSAPVSAPRGAVQTTRAFLAPTQLFEIAVAAVIPVYTAMIVAPNSKVTKRYFPLLLHPSRTDIHVFNLQCIDLTTIYKSGIWEELLLQRSAHG
jgi:hypothetical protein